MIAKIILGGVEMTQTIMIIDDEIEILDMLKRYFSLEGYHVITAAGGKEALQKLSKQPDLMATRKTPTIPNGGSWMRRPPRWSAAYSE